MFVTPKFCVSVVFSFSWELKWPQEKLKKVLMQNFGMTNKEHYGMLWYFLEWLIILHSTKSYPVYCKHSFIYLVDFLKTTLMKFAVIWVKRCEKAGFLSPRSSKIIVTKEEKERVMRRKEGQQRKAMVALLVFIIATLTTVFGLTLSFKDWFSKKINSFY